MVEVVNTSGAQNIKDGSDIEGQDSRNRRPPQATSTLKPALKTESAEDDGKDSDESEES